MIIPVGLLISVLKKYLSHQINMKVFAALLLLAFASCGFAEDQTCYQKGANDCSGACAWNFMSLCCSDKNGPPCHSHAAFVHHVPSVHPTTINDAHTQKVIGHGPPVVVHHPVAVPAHPVYHPAHPVYHHPGVPLPVHHPAVPPLAPHPMYHPHPAVYGHQATPLLRRL